MQILHIFSGNLSFVGDTLLKHGKLVDLDLNCTGE